jgi:hypothetical protein
MNVAQKEAETQDAHPVSPLLLLQITSRSREKIGNEYHE